MSDKPIYIDPLGNRLVYDDGVYVVEYPPIGDSEESEVEELPFQVGDSKNGVNGVSNELLVRAVIHRLERLEIKKPSIFNRLAIQLLKTACKFLEEKGVDEEFNERFKDVRLNDGDANALEVIRWRAVVDGIEKVGAAQQEILTKTYRNGSKMRSVDIKRLKNADIIARFQNKE